MSETLGPGSVVAYIKCPSCGTVGAAKLNKNLNAYLICRGSHPPAPDQATGDACNGRMNFGQAASEKFRTAYTDARQGAERDARQEGDGNDRQDSGVDTGGGPAAPKRATGGQGGAGGAGDTGNPGNGAGGAAERSGGGSFIDKILG